MPQLDNCTLGLEQLTLEVSCDENANYSISNYTNLTDVAGTGGIEGPPGLNIPYAVMEALVAIVAVIGNALVIIVFYRERRLRRRTNYYIISLAFADFLVGLLGIPFAILVSLKIVQNLIFDVHRLFDSIGLLIAFLRSESTGVNWFAKESLRLSAHNIVAGCSLHHFDILPRRCLYRSLLGELSAN